MATPRQLGFASPGDSDDNSPSSPSYSRRKSSRKAALKRRALESVAGEEIKKKKKNNSNKKLASPSSNWIWNEEDELFLLKRLVDYRSKTRFQPKIDWDDVYRFVGGSVVAKVSKKQLSRKIRMLKWQYFVHLKRINAGNDPLFTRASDSQVFGYCSMLWGLNESDFANHGMDHDAQDCESSDEEDEGVAMVEPLNENVVAKGDFDGKCKSHLELVVDKTVDDNGTAAAGKESHDDDDDDDDDTDAADELFAVRDAFETLLSQGLSDFKKKFLLEKLMKLGTGKRKELSNGWKALCVEEVKLHIKKLRFSAELAEAANQR